MKQIVTILLFATLLCKTTAQNYTQSVGLRGGYASGIVYNNDLNSAVSNLFILKLKASEMNATFMRVLYEPNSFGYSPKLMIYKGYGAHVGYRYDDYFKTLYGDVVYPKKQFYPVLGFDVILGMEYRIEEFPFTVGLDAKPFFEFTTRQIFRLYLPDVAFVLKYRF